MILKIAIVITSVLVIAAILLFMGNRMYHRNVKLGREIQQKYWTANADEKKLLLEKGIEDLSWEDSLLLLHLTCLEMLSNGPGREQLMLEGQPEEASQDAPLGENRDLVLRLVKRLCSDASPYRPCNGAVWQSKRGKPEESEPDKKGITRNASLTHLGCIEVIRLDDKKKPAEISFISFDELNQAIFKTGGLFRLADFEFNDGRPIEEMLVPLQYGISWTTPNTFDRDGTYTRFICHIESKQHESPINIGVGHQDFLIESGDGTSLLGLGSIGKLSVIHSK
jgi:hypothetical protein